MMRTRIKLCGFVRPGDVDDAVALGVDMVGFVFYSKSPRFLRLDEARALRARLPSYVCAVGLFVNEPIDSLLDVVGALGLDLVQLHGDESPGFATSLAARGRPYWRAVRVRQESDLLESFEAFGDAEAFLLDSYTSGYGGSGSGFDWSMIPRSRPRPVVLSGGLGPDTVATGIRQVKPMAVDASSSVQGADPRRKDAALMARFVEAVMIADRAATGASD